MAFNLKKAIFGDEEDNLSSNVEEEFYMVSGKDIKDDDDNGNKMILVEPRAYSESQTIADHLKKRNSVVVNLKRVTSDQAKRIIDFLTGCIYAIGDGIYLCTPKNVTVQGKMTEGTDKPEKKMDEIEF